MDVDCFLAKIGMLKYSETFHAHGFDLISDVCHLTSADLEDVLNISSAQDRNFILNNGNYLYLFKHINRGRWGRVHIYAIAMAKFHYEFGVLSL